MNLEQQKAEAQKELKELGKLKDEKAEAQKELKELGKLKDEKAEAQKKQAPVKIGNIIKGDIKFNGRIIKKGEELPSGLFSQKEELAKIGLL